MSIQHVHPVDLGTAAELGDQIACNESGVAGHQRGQPLGSLDELGRAGGDQRGRLAGAPLLLLSQPLGAFGQRQQARDHQRHDGEHQHRHRQGAAERSFLRLRVEVIHWEHKGPGGRECRVPERQGHARRS